MNAARFWTVVLLLAGSLAMLRIRGDHDQAVPARPLEQFPYALDGWAGTDIAIDPAVLEVMGKGVFLNRLYTSPASSGTPPVALFLAYFPTQRTGQSIHSPQNCLPGAGWTFESSGTTRLLTPPGAPAQTVGEYLIGDGASHDEVLYWYQSQGQAIASDYRAKLVMVWNSIRYNRSDAALVRIVTPVQAGESREEARQRALAFAQQATPLLPTYIPQ